MKQNLNIEKKGLIDTIINRFADIMSIRQYQPKLNQYLRGQLMKSFNKIENELKPSINFVPNEKEITFLNEYVFQNLQNNADAVGNALRQELQRGILNKESPSQLKQRVKDVFADQKYSQRLKTVMRTEKLRANNAGAFSGAVQAEEYGIQIKKYLDVTRDKNSTDICNHGNKDSAFNKYGSKDKAIPLDEEFVMRANNKTYRALYPPMHVNCRSVVRFVRYSK